MALHTGETEERGDDYVGPLLNRVARLMSAGYGEQVLLTRATAELVQDHLPQGTRLRDLGQHRLKDLERPEHVFQLAAPGLPHDFPQLNTLEARPNNLPVQLTSFIGRDYELNEVQELLTSTRLLTLTGPGGVGKTRLALQAAAQKIESYPDGVFFVPLTAVKSPDYLPQSIAEALQFNFDSHSSNRSPEAQLLEYLEKRSLLLVLDNFEHLMSGTRLLAEMLGNSPQIYLLVTSRERLKLQGEWIYEVQGMNYPTNGSNAGLEAYSAVRLFLERARQVQSRITLTEVEKPCVKRICQLVQGMPLGIELAAGWLPVLTCQEIAEEIETSLDFLESTQRDQPDKHRSLRAAFEYSWKLLENEPRRVFRSLSVFQGGFDRKAAAQILNANLMTLAELVDKSFLRRTDQGRYEIHELLRQFGAERLNAHPELKMQVRERHSQYYVEFLLSKKKTILGEDLVRVREQIRIEKENIRAALYWAVTNWPALEASAALDAYSMYFFAQGWYEGFEAFQNLISYTQANRAIDRVYYNARVNYTIWAAALTHLDDADTVCREDLPILRQLKLNSELGICLFVSGIIACERGEYEKSLEFLYEAIPYLSEFQHKWLVGEAYMWLGYVFYLQGDYEAGKTHFIESYQIYQNHQNLVGTSFALSKLGLVEDARQDYSSARRYHLEARDIFVRFGDLAGEAYTNSRISVTAYGQGNYAEAVELGRAGLEKFTEIGHVWGMGASNCRIGFAAIELGDLNQAEKCFQEAMRRAKEAQHTPLMLYALAGMGNVIALQGAVEQGLELIACVLAHPMTPSVYREVAERRLPEFKATIGGNAYNAALARGSKYDLEQVLQSLEPVKPTINS